MADIAPAPPPPRGPVWKDYLRMRSTWVGLIVLATLLAGRELAPERIDAIAESLAAIAAVWLIGTRERTGGE